MKRTDYISWDEYFMGVALLAARRSKDPNTQVGACIVSPENIILSTGYNGLPCCCSDDVFPWEREGAETKYPYVVHAELNAILNAGGRVLRGARLYVALFPCNECAKAIIQSGIREIIYFSDKYAETANIRASKRMLDAAGVRYHPLQTELASITLDFRAPESAGIPQKSDADEKKSFTFPSFYATILRLVILPVHPRAQFWETAPEGAFRPPGLSRWIIF